MEVGLARDSGDVARGVGDRDDDLVVVAGGRGGNRGRVGAVRAGLDRDGPSRALDDLRVVGRHDLLLDEVVFGAGGCSNGDELGEPNGDGGAANGGASWIELPDRASR